MDFQGRNDQIPQEPRLGEGSRGLQALGLPFTMIGNLGVG